MMQHNFTEIFTY